MAKEKPPICGERLPQNIRFVGDEIYKDGNIIPLPNQATNDPSLSNSFIRTGPGSWQHIGSVLHHIVSSLYIVDAGGPSR